MKIENFPEGGFILKEVFSGVLLKTEDGEEIGICMRDTGFEFDYGGIWYSAQKGKIKKLGPGKTKSHSATKESNA